MSDLPKRLGIAFTPHPMKCDICGSPSTGMEVMFDAATTKGGWAMMCEGCYKVHRKYNTLGLGRGQKYKRFGDRFHLVHGVPVEED